MVTYSEDGKYAYFGGMAFCRDEKTGYYLNSTTRRRLHRCVYEAVHGEIPEGWQVHHIDHNKNNNEPENLELLTAEQHSQRHADEMSDDLRELYKENMVRNVIPAAVEWHRSEAAKEWHRKQFIATKDALYARKAFVCKQCGKEYESIDHGRNFFCSNACSAKWRRDSGVDDETRVCAVCGNPFTVNKYKKTRCCSPSCSQRLRHQKCG